MICSPGKKNAEMRFRVEMKSGDAEDFRADSLMTKVSWVEAINKCLHASLDYG